MKRMANVLLCLCALLPLAANGGDETAASDAKAINLSAPGVFPIADETVELTLFKSQSEYVSDYEDNAFTNWLEEKTNVHINFMLAPSADVNQKINLLLASGSDLPDVFNGNSLGADLLAKYGEQEIFVPLNDLIDDNMINFKKIVQERAEKQILKQITLADGTIYALPKMNMGCIHCYYDKKMFINSSFLDVVGMDAPTNTDELYEVLKAFKENDVNGNGDPSDEIPMAGAKNGWGQLLWTNLINSFQYYDARTQGLSLENGKVYAAFTQEGWKEGLRYLNKLVEEGLMDPTTFTMDNKQHRQLFFKNGGNTIGVFTSGSYAAYRNPETLSFSYEPIEPLTGPTGLKQAAYMPYRDVETGHFAITSECDNPVAAIKWADFFYTEEADVRGRWGVEGTDWKRAPEGTIGANGKPAVYTTVLKWNTIQNSHWHAEHIMYRTSDWALGEAILDDPSKNYPYSVTQVAMNVYKPHTPPIDIFVPPLAFTADEYDEMGDLINTINDYVLESVSRFAVGDLDVDTDWDAYLKELDAMGLPQILTMNQSAYDRQWK